MKRIKNLILISTVLLLILLSTTCLAVININPTPEFYVNDFASVLSPATKSMILQTNLELQSKTGAQIVVVTVNILDQAVLEDYTLNILRSWGIGSKEKNNGVLIFLSVGDRKSRIEVGYGLEGILPDAKTGRIQDDYMLPYYLQGNYDEGIKNGFNVLLNEVASEYNVDISNQIPAPRSIQSTKNPFANLPPLTKIIIAIIVATLLLFDWIFLHGVISRSLFWILLFSLRRGGGGGGGGNWGGGGSGGGGGSSRNF